MGVTARLGGHQTDRSRRWTLTSCAHRLQRSLCVAALHCYTADESADRNAMDAFRYLVSVNERSARTIELTEAIVRMCPGHYSVWCAHFLFKGLI